MNKILLLMLALISCSSPGSKPGSRSHGQAEPDTYVPQISEENPAAADTGLIDTSIVNQVISYYRQKFKGCKTIINADYRSRMELTFEYRNNNDDSNFCHLDIYLSKEKKDYVSGDLNNDGTADVVAAILTERCECSADMAWNDIFVFFRTDNKYRLKTCQPAWKISASKVTDFSPCRIEHGVIIGTLEERWSSGKYEARVKLHKNSLVMQSKRKITE